LSVRAKWVACVAAFAVGGLVASIPAFIDRSAPARSRDARYAWLDGLPRGDTVIGTAPDGQQLRAARIGREGLCMRFGSSGRQCVAVDTTKQVQLVARVRGREENVLWGVVADDVSALRIRHADGTAISRDARYGFGVLEPRGDKVISISALDDSGRRIGVVPGDVFVPVACALTSCVTIDVS
jgi:hypothetical protein